MYNSVLPWLYSVHVCHCGGWQNTAIVTGIICMYMYVYMAVSLLSLIYLHLLTGEMEYGASGSSFLGED